MSLENKQIITWRCDLCGAEKKKEVVIPVNWGMDSHYWIPGLPDGWVFLPDYYGPWDLRAACDRHWLSVTDAGFDVKEYVKFNLEGLPREEPVETGVTAEAAAKAIRLLTNPWRELRAHIDDVEKGRQP